MHSTRQKAAVSDADAIAAATARLNAAREKQLKHMQVHNVITNEPVVLPGPGYELTWKAPLKMSEVAKACKQFNPPFAVDHLKQDLPPVRRK